MKTNTQFLSAVDEKDFSLMNKESQFIEEQEKVNSEYFDYPFSNTILMPSFNFSFLDQDRDIGLQARRYSKKGPQLHNYTFDEAKTERKSFVWLLDTLAVSDNDIPVKSKCIKLLVPYTLEVVNKTDLKSDKQQLQFNKYYSSGRILVRKKQDDFNNAKLANEIAEQSDQPNRFLEKTFGKDQDDFRSNELDAYEKVVLDLIINRVNNARSIKITTLSEEVRSNKNQEHDILEILMQDIIASFLIYKKQEQAITVKQTKRGKRDLDAFDKINTVSILDKLKSRWKNEKKEDSKEDKEKKGKDAKDKDNNEAFDKNKLRARKRKIKEKLISYDPITAFELLMIDIIMFQIKNNKSQEKEMMQLHNQESGYLEEQKNKDSYDDFNVLKCLGDTESSNELTMDLINKKIHKQFIKKLENQENKLIEEKKENERKNNFLALSLSNTKVSEVEIVHITIPKIELDLLEILIQNIDSELEKDFAREKDKKDKEKDDKEKSKTRLIYGYVKQNASTSAHTRDKSKQKKEILNQSQEKQSLSEYRTANIKEFQRIDQFQMQLNEISEVDLESRKRKYGFRNQFEQIWNNSFNKQDNVIDIPLDWQVFDESCPKRIVKAAELLTFNLINLLQVVHNREVEHIETLFGIDRYGLLYLIRTNKLVVKRDKGDTVHTTKDKNLSKIMSTDQNQTEVNRFTSMMTEDPQYQELHQMMNVKDLKHDNHNDEMEQAFHALRPNAHDQNMEEQLEQNYKRAYKIRNNITNYNKIRTVSREQIQSSKFLKNVQNYVN